MLHPSLFFLGPQLGNSSSLLHLAPQRGVEPLALREHLQREWEASAGIGSSRSALAEVESIQTPLTRMVSGFLLMHSHNTPTPTLWYLLHSILSHRSSERSIDHSINQVYIGRFLPRKNYYDHPHFQILRPLSSVLARKFPCQYLSPKAPVR